MCVHTCVSAHAHVVCTAVYARVVPLCEGVTVLSSERGLPVEVGLLVPVYSATLKFFLPTTQPRPPPPSCRGAKCFFSNQILPSLPRLGPHRDP